MRVRVAAAGLAAAVAAEWALRRRRPRTTHGRYADWSAPGLDATRSAAARRGGPTAAGLGTALGAAADVVANSRVLRALCEQLPVPPMTSAITDVVYVNYVVEATRLRRWLPGGLELQLVGPGKDRAVFSFLTYRHGHLGPTFATGARRFFPSPIQTNWRTYVREPTTGLTGVYFLTTAVTHPGYALGGRLLCEGLPSHLLRTASLTREAGTVTMTLDPGRGSAPDATAVLRETGSPTEGPWRQAFTTYADMLGHVVPQDRALSVQPWAYRLTHQEIALDIPVTACVPLTGGVESAYANSLTGNAEPFSFLVPAVDFRMLREARLRLR